jgi:hypothetical protein
MANYCSCGFGLHRLCGRTSFWDPLADWRGKKITRDARVAEIARRYQLFVDIFETREKAVSVWEGKRRQDEKIARLTNFRNGGDSICNLA